MEVPPNLTPSQQEALDAYRQVLGKRYCCNQGACPGCNAPRVRSKAREAGVSEEELSRALRESREASRRQSQILSAKPLVAESPPEPPLKEAPKS